MSKFLPDLSGEPRYWVRILRFAGALAIGAPAICMALATAFWAAVGVFCALVLLAVKGEVLAAVLLLVLCGTGFLFAYSLLATLLRRQNHWRVGVGLALGFTALTVIMIEAVPIPALGQWGGPMRQFKLGAGSATLIYTAWITTGALLVEMLVSFFTGRKKKMAMP